MKNQDIGGKEKRVDNKCLQDAEKSCVIIKSEEQKERSPSSDSIKYISDKESIFVVMIKTC
jgi:hypothetical protein